MVVAAIFYTRERMQLAVSLTTTTSALAAKRWRGEITHSAGGDGKRLQFRWERTPMIRGGTGERGVFVGSGRGGLWGVCFRAPARLSTHPTRMEGTNTFAARGGPSMTYAYSIGKFWEGVCPFPSSWG